MRQLKFLKFHFIVIFFFLFYLLTLVEHISVFFFLISIIFCQVNKNWLFTSCGVKFKLVMNIIVSFGYEWFVVHSKIIYLCNLRLKGLGLFLMTCSTVSIISCFSVFCCIGVLVLLNKSGAGIYGARAAIKYWHL